jgi:hypothetical protein
VGLACGILDRCGRRAWVVRVLFDLVRTHFGLWIPKSV